MVRVAALVFLVACGSSGNTEEAPPRPKQPPPVVTPPVGPVVKAAGFDRACTAATDCVVVKPAGCDPCACATEAIASKAMAQFDEAVGKLACEPPDLSVRCAPCQLYAAGCVDQACVATPRF